MKRLPITRVVLTTAAITILASPLTNAADARIDLGKQEYENSCAHCHGRNAKGDGPFGELLEVKIPDLTTLAQRNGGVFPVDRIYSVIDGRQEIKSHGSREMPIWGRHFVRRAAPEHDDYPHVPEAFVRARILLLIDYLNRLQVK